MESNTVNACNKAAILCGGLAAEVLYSYANLTPADQQKVLALATRVEDPESENTMSRESAMVKISNIMKLAPTLRDNA